MKLLRARLEGNTVDEQARAAIQGRESFQYDEVFATVHGVECRCRVLTLLPEVPGEETIVLIPHNAGEWVEPVVCASFLVSQSYRTDVSRN